MEQLSSKDFSEQFSPLQLDGVVSIVLNWLLGSSAELVAGQFGCVDRDNLGRVAYEMGAFPLRDAGRVAIARMRKQRKENKLLVHTNWVAV